LVRGEFPEPVIRRIVTCLFACARAGDGLATRIIEDTGSRLGAAAAALMRALVLRGSNAVVVLGGAMFQTEGHHQLVDAATRRIRQTINEAHVLLLSVAPVIGGVLFARDLVSHSPLDFATALRAQDARIDVLCEGPRS
jgi:N-acetylglucosamine kinase-like BadF-type ATPase